MSFSSDVKAELCREALTRRCCTWAEAYGVLLYAGSFSAAEVRIVTESVDFAARLPKLFQNLSACFRSGKWRKGKTFFRIHQIIFQELLQLRTSVSACRGFTAVNLRLR